MQTLICFDPGGTTGWCRFRRTFGPQWYVEEFGQFPVDRLSTLAELISSDDMIIYEQIQVLHLGFDPIGLRVIGAIELLRELNGNALRVQSPTVISGAKVWKELEGARKWFRKQPHAKDAFYHGMTYLGIENVDLTKHPSGSS